MNPRIALLGTLMFLVSAQLSAATVNTAECLINQPPPDPWNPPPPPEPGLCVTGVDGVVINGITYNVDFVYDTFTNLNVDGNFPFYPTYGGSGPSDAVDAINLAINTSGTTAEGILPAGKSTSTSHYAVAYQPSAGSFVNVSSGYFTFDNSLPMFRHEGGAEHTDGAAPHAVFTAVIATIDFEGAALGQFSDIVVDGFRFTGFPSYSPGNIAADTEGNQSLVVGGGGWCGPYGQCDYAQVTMTRVDGGAFSYFGADITESCGNEYYDGTCYSGYGGTKFGGGSATGPVGSGDWLNLQSVAFGISADTSSPDGLFFYSLTVDNIRLQTMPLPAVENIVIDLDPWSNSNEIRPKDEYLIGLMIKTTSVADGDLYDFDASTVDTDSLRAGPAGAQNVAVNVLTADYDQDGDTDYIYAFRVHETGLTCTSSTIMVTGSDVSGNVIGGSDIIVPIQCEEIATIDLDPWNAANEVRPNDSYTVPVAIMSTSVASGEPADIDATQVDPASLKFGPNQIPNTGSIIITDLNGDSDNDVVFGFDAYDSGIACGDSEITVVGELYDTTPIIGTDTITTVDCDTGCHP